MTKHRKIYTETFGDIPDKFHIHHLDGNHDNNNPLNLVAIPPSLHSKYHARSGDAQYILKAYSSTMCKSIEDYNTELGVLDMCKEAIDKLIKSKREIMPYILNDINKRNNIRWGLE